MIPHPWVTRPLGELVDVLDHRRIPVNKKERASRQGSIPYYGATGQVGWIDDALFDEPLLLLGEDGVQFFDRGKPKAYLVDGPAWVNNHAHVLRVRDSVAERRFLMYQMNWMDYHGYANGTTRLKLTKSALARMPIRLPVLAEQRRIVEVLEDHLSRLDAAEASLRNAARRVDGLRQSAMARLPWEPLRSLAEVAEIQGGIQKQPKRKPSLNPHPFLRVANVTADGLDLAQIHQIELFDGELERWRLLPGDLLVVEGNGSPRQIGRAATWDGSIPNCVHQNHLIRVRPGPQLCPAYLGAAWNSLRLRVQLSEVASSTSGLYTLSVAKLARLQVPVPPLDQQAEVAQRLRDLDQATGRLSSAVGSGLARATHLRGALLQAAFTGRLIGRASDEDVVQELAGV